MTGPVEFRRLTSPQPDGRVRIQIECRLEGILLGKILQVRGGFQYRPVGSGIGRRGSATGPGPVATGPVAGGWKVGEVYPTAAECKQSIAGEPVTE
jgi:hypothetical protein